jgi:dihydrofolate synthase/folylpolyglutamate synthase
LLVTYAEVLARLFEARRAGIVLGLDRVRAVLDRLGNPDHRLGAVVHVGGTNGKGSTVAMVAALARAAGKRVGVYTSPHLSSLRERIVVDGAMIDEDAVVAAAETVAAAGGDELTFFEQITAIALVHLAAAKPDVTVLEVGLGGRLDATNAVHAGVAVVTGVAMDHQAMLGDTLREIAGEKAGIFKSHQAAVIGASGEAAAVPWLEPAARTSGCDPVIVIDDARIAAVPATIGLHGAHQRANAAAAVAAIDALAIRLDGRARRSALADVRFAGRFETVAGAPRVILDGAHNPHAARALARAIAEVDPPRPRVLVLGVSADKDVAGIVDALVPAFDHVVATAYAQPRALEPAALAAAVASRSLSHPEAGTDAIAPPGIVAIAPNVTRALVAARAVAGKKGTVIVAGSLMLVGEARALLVGGPVDPIAVSDPAPPRR